MKDYYDLWRLSADENVDQEVAKLAVARTFRRRQTELPVAVPEGLSDDFARDAAKVILRMAHIIQEMRRDPDVLLDEIAKLLKASSRSIDGDVALLRKTGLLSSEGIKKGLTWRTNLELRERL